MSILANISQATEALLQLSMVIMIGLYFIFSNTIMTTLARVENGANVMVDINKQILNPVFLVCFVLSALASVYFLAFGSGLNRVSGGVFFVGTVVVTALKNVPLNNQLRDVKGFSEQQILWKVYLSKWVKWNHVRTLSAVVSGFLLVL